VLDHDGVVIEAEFLPVDGMQELGGFWVVDEVTEYE
jgi:hypothetical protein